MINANYSQRLNSVWKKRFGEEVDDNLIYVVDVERVLQIEDLQGVNQVFLCSLWTYHAFLNNIMMSSVYEVLLFHLLNHKPFTKLGVMLMSLLLGLMPYFITNSIQK